MLSFWSPPYTRGMRQFTVVLGVCLAVNVVVTWTLAIVRPQQARATRTTSAVVGQGDTARVLRRVSSPGMTRLYWTPPEEHPNRPQRLQPPPVPDLSRLAPRWSHVAGRPPDPALDVPAHTLVEVAFGWPWEMASYEYRRFGKTWTEPHGEVSGAMDLGDVWVSGRQEVKALPLRPAWAGLVGNTVLYAVFIVGLVGVRHLVNEIVAVRWSRFGRCPACGYDLTGSAGTRCPECGRILGSTSPGTLP